MPEQSIQLVPTVNNRVVITAHFPKHSPDQLFRYWIEPSLLTQWWPTEAELSPQLDGAYCLSWPQMNWHLRGIFTAFEPGKTLGFTWHWDHEPDRPERQVRLQFGTHPAGGTSLTLTHGSYTDSQIDQEERQSHIDGWLHFLNQLYKQ